MEKARSITTILLGLISGTTAFRYKDAEHWGEQYSQCNGQYQSPIIMNGDAAEEIRKDLRLKDFTKLPTKLTVMNTGHTVEMKADWSGDPPSVTGGPLHGSYVFEKNTFHWARRKWTEQFVPEGLEIDPSTYMMDMEMHMFFYRKDFESFEKAETQKGGLAVFKIGLMIRSSDDKRHSFGNLEKNLHKVQSPNSTTEITPFRILHDYGDGDNPFLFYEGSLDYPPCAESVTWIICNFSDLVSEGLVREFRKIKLSGGDVSNVRPARPQKKHKVKIVYEYNGRDHIYQA